MPKNEKKISPESEDNTTAEKSEDSHGVLPLTDSESGDTGDSELLSELIGKAASGIYFLSETDAEILPFIGSEAESVSAEELFRQTQISGDTPFVERDFEDFFLHLTEITEWSGGREPEKSQGFAGLKKVLEENLTEIRVYAIGQISLDIFLVGRNQQNVLMGIRTRAVET